MKHLHFSPSTAKGKAKLIPQAKPSSTFLSVQTLPAARTSMALHHWDEPGRNKGGFLRKQPGEMKVKRTELGRTQDSVFSGADSLCLGARGPEV